MHLTDPLNGLKQTDGSAMFHIAFFLSSMCVVSFDKQDKFDNGLE